MLQFRSSVAAKSERENAGREVDAGDAVILSGNQQPIFSSRLKSAGPRFSPIIIISATLLAPIRISRQSAVLRGYGLESNERRLSVYSIYLLYSSKTQLQNATTYDWQGYLNIVPISKPLLEFAGENENLR